MNKPARYKRLHGLMQKHWQPKPIHPPMVDPALPDLTGVQRSAEVIRYSILSLEFWLSPLGRLREWIRLNSKLSMVLLAPAVLVLPLITWIIYQVSGWISMLVGLLGHLILLPMVALLAAVSIVVITRLIGHILSR